VNNIVDSYGSDWDSEEITIGYRMDTAGSIDTSNLVLDNNLFYRPESSNHILLGRSTASGDPGGSFSASSYNAAYGTNNYQTSSGGLYKGTSGADKYKIVGSFSLGGATVATGGGGQSHPFLTGVTLPSYVGAVDPGSDDWVDTVMSLVDLNTTSIPPGSPGDVIPYILNIELK